MAIALLRGEERCLGRALQRGGPVLEVVAQRALGRAQRVAAVLRHHERDLVDVLARGGLCLLLAVGDLPTPLVLDHLLADTAGEERPRWVRR